MRRAIEALERGLGQAVSVGRREEQPTPGSQAVDRGAEEAHDVADVFDEMKRCHHVKGPRMARGKLREARTVTLDARRKTPDRVIVVVDGGTSRDAPFQGPQEQSSPTTEVDDPVIWSQPRPHHLEVPAFSGIGNVGHQLAVEVRITGDRITEPVEPARVAAAQDGSVDGRVASLDGFREGRSPSRLEILPDRGVRDGARVLATGRGAQRAVSKQEVLSIIGARCEPSGSRPSSSLSFRQRPIRPTSLLASGDFSRPTVPRRRARSRRAHPGVVT